MGKLLLIAIFALLLAEIGAFIFAARAIGGALASALLVLTSLAGIFVLRRPGRGRLERLRVGVTQSGLSGLEAGGDAFLTVAAGILLLVPGFVTDAAGLCLLLPPVRRWINGRFSRFVRTQSPQAAAVVDLDRRDWERVQDQSGDGEASKKPPP